MTIEEIRRQLLPGDIQLIADKSGLFRNTVGNYLNQRHRPKPDTEKKILEAFAEIMQQRKAMKERLRNSLTT